MTEIIDYRGYSIKIKQDEFADSPRMDRDNLGELHSWSRDISGDVNHTDYVEVKDIVAELELGSVTLSLKLFDHGSSGSGVYIVDYGDGNANGFITVSPEKIREEYKCKRITAQTRALVEGALRSEIEEFNQYLAGDVYGFIIDGPGIVKGEESVWGFYGYEYCLTEAKAWADTYANEIEAQGEAMDFALARV